MTVRELPTEQHFVEITAAGRTDWARGYTEELADLKDDVLRYHGDGDPGAYLKLLSDDQVQPTFRQRRTSIIARETIVEPGGTSGLDIAAADHLRAQLKAISWDRACWRQLICILCGYAVSELVYDIDDSGKVVIQAIKNRRSGRFRFGKDGSSLFLIDPSKRRMPERKFWTSSWGAEDDDNPHGLGLGYSLWWPVWFKRHSLKFWAQFLEVYSQPIPFASVPVGTSEVDQLKLLGKMGAIQSGGRAVFPNNIKLELLQAMKDSGGDYDRFVARIDSAIAKIVLLQTMTTDDGSSLAQGQVHERVSQVGAKADSDLITETFVAGPARWLTEWNFPGAKTPLVYRDFAEAVDQSAAAERDAKIYTLGYRPTAERVRQTYGDGYELAPATAPQAPAAFAERPLPNINEAVDALVSGDRWREVLGPEVDNVEALLADCGNLEQVRDRLGELFKREPQALADALARSMFAGALAGNLGAEEE